MLKVALLCLIIRLMCVFLQFTHTFAITPERLQYYIGGRPKWLQYYIGGGTAKRLQYYMGRGGSTETRKSDYVIYGWPLRTTTHVWSQPWLSLCSHSYQVIILPRLDFSSQLKLNLSQNEEVVAQSSSRHNNRALRSSSSCLVVWDRLDWVRCRWSSWCQSLTGTDLSTCPASTWSTTILTSSQSLSWNSRSSAS